MADGPRKIELPHRRHHTFWQRTRSNFLTGLIVTGPLLLTIYIIWGIVGFIDNKVIPWLPAAYNPETWLGRDIPGFGVVIFLLFTAIIGALTKGLVGRQLVRYGENFVDRMPIVRSIYNALKQILETVLSQDGTSFQRACLVEYPRKGAWGVGFLAGETKGEIPAKTGQRGMMSVFLPTTPNPTSGFLIFFPVEDVIILDMSIEDAAKLIISGGMINPPTPAEIAARKAEYMSGK